MLRAISSYFACVMNSFPVLHCLCHEQFPQNWLFLSRTIKLYFVAYVTNNFPVLRCLCHEQLTRNSLLVSRTISSYSLLMPRIISSYMLPSLCHEQFLTIFFFLLLSPIISYFCHEYYLPCWLFSPRTIFPSLFFLSNIFPDILGIFVTNKFFICFFGTNYLHLFYCFFSSTISCHNFISDLAIAEVL